MISYFEALSTIEDNFSKFNNWISYLNSELKLHLPNQKDRIGVFKVVFTKECDEMVYECFKKMERYTSKADKQHKDDFVYCNIHNIDSLFVKLKSHEKAFILSSVKKEFKSINIIWNEKDFSLLMEASNVAVSILQEQFESYLPEYLERSSAYLSNENKNNLLKYSKNDFIKSIVVSILDGRLGKEVKEPVKTTAKKNTAKYTKIKESHTSSFMLNHFLIKGMPPSQVLERKELINKKFLDLLLQLRKNGFIHADASDSNLKSIINTTEVKKKVIWKGTKGALHYFGKLMDDKLDKGYNHWISIANCFIDKEGKEIIAEKIRSDYGKEEYKSKQSKLDSITKEFTSFEPKNPLN